MMFHSTNHNTSDVDFKTAILRGQALDKGLYMLNEIPSISSKQIYSMKDMEMQEIAHIVFSKIIGKSIPKNELKNLINEALNFEAPVKQINEEDYICYLDRGPTNSFKDIGMRMLAKCMEYFLKQEEKKIVILVATSGDTGGAACNAFYNIENIKVVVLYPKNEISDLQRKQMTTLGGNITAIGIQGKFDDCQRYVKQAFADEELSYINLSSANSINFGRLLPQTLYYFWSYSRVTEEKGEKILFSVPSGNFGNLMGGLIAHKMGLPIKKFISAVNENNEFPNFLQTGTYQKIEPSKNCISNAMNVGHPSNLARLIDLYGGQMDEKGNIHEQPNMKEIRNEIVSYSISDELTKETIMSFYKNYNKIIEPHGAVGWAAKKIYREKFPIDDIIKSVTLETADPAKFPEQIIDLIDINPEVPSSLKTLENKKEFPNSAKIETYQDFKQFLKKTY
ncbi:MAG: threonine synthase [Promethearchaeota archaeon]|nr:MAG: threonine synthase [Candidatus Lokiarchaeota archaeon]